MIYRRSFLKGMSALFIAPAIIRVENLMPIKEYMPAVPVWCPEGWLPFDGREIKRKFYPDLYEAYCRMHFPLNVSNFSDPVVPADLPSNERRVISYKDFKRSNGTIMRAGAGHTIYLPEGVT